VGARVIHIDADGVEWLRVGQCSHCGECCAPSPGSAYFTPEELAAQTCATHCPLLRWNDGKSFCVGHGTHPLYLSGCDEHPKQPADLLLTPSCTFAFVAVS
jgi:hypothetical protein